MHKCRIFLISEKRSRLYWPSDRKMELKWPCKDSRHLPMHYSELWKNIYCQAIEIITNSSSYEPEWTQWKEVHKLVDQWSFVNMALVSTETCEKKIEKSFFNQLDKSLAKDCQVFSEREAELERFWGLLQTLQCTLKHLRTTRYCSGCSGFELRSKIHIKISI